MNFASFHFSRKCLFGRNDCPGPGDAGPSPPLEEKDDLRGELGQLLLRRARALQGQGPVLPQLDGQGCPKDVLPLQNGPVSLDVERLVSGPKPEQKVVGAHRTLEDEERPGTGALHQDRERYRGGV